MRTAPEYEAAITVRHRGGAEFLVLLAHYGAWIYIVQGTVFALCVLIFRRGLVGEINLRFNTRL